MTSSIFEFLALVTMLDDQVRLSIDGADTPQLPSRSIVAL